MIGPRAWARFVPGETCLLGVSRRVALLLLAAAAIATAAGAQISVELALIDFGDAGRRTIGAARFWNNVDPPAMAGSTPLIDPSGAPTGASLVFTGSPFVNAGGAGTPSPVPSSPLANLGYPVNVTADYLYGSNSRPVVEFALTNLDVNATYDFTICASRMSVTDVRTTEYSFLGASAGSVILDAANNDAKIAAVPGVSPSAAGVITVRLRAAASNTNPNGYFYLNALGVTKNGGGPNPPALAFFPGSLTLSRVVGRPPAPTSLTIAANRSPGPAVSLNAIDLGTNAPPNWLSFPSTVTGGRAFPLDFGNAAIPVGTYRAVLHANAPGYVPASTAITLTVRPAGALNILWYGNSFSLGNGTVPDLMRFIAEDFGLPSPYVVKRLKGGTDLEFHLTDPAHAGAITNGLALGEEWDFVVLQGHSVEATGTLGDPQKFRANAKAIFTNVRAHSPGARAILFQTWARARGHSFYQGTNPIFANPLEMHRQVESGYVAAVSDLESAFGRDSARRAAAGETAALFDFDPAVYAPDKYHAGPPITLMSAMSIFTAIYGRRVAEFRPDFNATTNLVQRLKAFRMVPDDWRRFGGIADRVADPVHRPYPGSGEDFLLRTATDGLLTAGPIKDLSAGQFLEVEVTSPIGTYDGATAFVVLSWFPTGLPPVPPRPFPEVHVHPAQSLIIATTPALTTLSWRARFPVAVTGWSLFCQSAVARPSAKTGHVFTVTDGQEIRMR